MTYWPARSPVLIALVAAAGALLLAWNISLLFKLLTSPDIAAPGDFSALWSIGRFVLAHGFHGLYDSETLNAFRHDLGDLDEIAAPYLYPPPFALFMALFALLPLRTAYFAFMGLTLALYLWAATKGSWRWSLVLLALPTTAIALAAGQNGFLTGALLLGGLRLRETRPILAGILFGALAYKPQFGLLIPIALLGARQWRVIASAAATCAIAVVLLSLAFGPAIWLDWLTGLRSHAEAHLGDMPIGHLMPTIHQAALWLGPTPATIIQNLAALLAAWLVWRRAPDTAVALGLYVASPYGFIYDLPAAAAAALWWVQARLARGFSILEIATLLAIVLTPILSFGTSFAWGVLPIAVLFALALKPGTSDRSPPRSAADDRSAAPASTPR